MKVCDEVREFLRLIFDETGGIPSKLVAMRLLA